MTWFRPLQPRARRAALPYPVRLFPARQLPRHPEMTCTPLPSRPNHDGTPYELHLIAHPEHGVTVARVSSATGTRVGYLLCEDLLFDPLDRPRWWPNPWALINDLAHYGTLFSPIAASVFAALVGIDPDRARAELVLLALTCPDLAREITALDGLTATVQP